MIGILLSNWKILLGVILILALASAGGYIAVLRAQNVSAKMSAAASAKLAEDTSRALSDYQAHAQAAQDALSAELVASQARAQASTKIRTRIVNGPVSTTCSNSPAIGALLSGLRGAAANGAPTNPAPNP